MGEMDDRQTWSTGGEWKGEAPDHFVVTGGRERRKEHRRQQRKLWRPFKRMLRKAAKH